METALQQLVNALTVGSLYALIALGYTMVYGVLRLINFAHGDVFMLGAFVGAYSARALNLWLGRSPHAPEPLWMVALGILLAMAICAAIGYTIERFAYRPLRNSSRLSALITAIGVSLLIEYLAQMQWPIAGQVYFGPSPTEYPEAVYFQDSIFGLLNGLVGYLHAGWQLPAWLLKLHITIAEIVILTVTALTLLVVRFVVLRTRMGKAMRAVSLSYDTSRLMGIDLNRVISFTFIFGSALAGLGGCLHGLKYHQITPTMGILIGLKAFVAAVIGGIGNIPGAAAGGLLLGLTETLVSSLGYSRYQDAIAFFVLILVLLVRPEGLFGKALPEKV